jgi:peptide/nickel transport system substrate-binding protein
MRRTLVLTLVAAVLGTVVGQAATTDRTTLTIGNYNVQANTLDPRKPQGGLSMETDLLFNALVRIDRFGNPQPDAATWTTPDDTAIVFELRPGITFSDGTEMTAEDVKFTFDTIRDPEFGAPNVNNYAVIRDIEVVDRYTVRFNLSEAYAPLLQYLSNSYTGIVPRHIAEADPDGFGRNPVGSGPYVLERWSPAEEAVLTVREDYWEGAPSIRRVVIRAQEDDNVRLLQFEVGSLDVALRVPLGEITRIVEAGEFNVITAPPSGFEFIGFMMQEPPFDDERVRQAIAHAIDKDLIVSLVFFGLTERADGPVPPTLWAYNPAVEEVYSYDPERARELLAEAGYGDGFSTSLQFSGRWQEPSYTQVVQNMLAEIGVRVELVQREWGSHLDDLFAGNIDGMYVLAWTPVWDPDQVMYRSFLTDNSFNWGGYSNPRVDELLEAGRNVLDEAERKAIYDEAQLLVVQDAPYVFLQLTPYHAITHPDLQGFDLGAQGWGFFDAMLTAEWATD